MIIAGISKIIDILLNKPSSITIDLFISTLIEIFETTFEAITYIAIGSFLGQWLDDWLEYEWGDDKSMEEFTTLSLSLKLFIHVAGILVIRSIASEYFMRVPNMFTGHIGENAGSFLFYASVAWHSPHLESDAEEVIKRISKWMKSFWNSIRISIFRIFRGRRSTISSYYDDNDSNYYYTYGSSNKYKTTSSSMYNEFGMAHYNVDFTKNNIYNSLFTL